MREDRGSLEGLGLLPHSQIEKFYGADGAGAADVPEELALAFRVMFGTGRGWMTLLNRGPVQADSR